MPATTPQSRSFWDIFIPLLMVSPVIFLVRTVPDIVPGLPKWGEYILFTLAAYLLATGVYSSIKRHATISRPAISIWRAIPVVLGISAAGLLIALAFVVAPFIFLSR